ncbi:MAG: hypothetical protein SPJ04_09960 [Bdellovibrionota bacterium]|nr:hypothetical protein [Pseudomonadota bacterium]MDY6091554.1 hypothetical protein [Bdellovibrionota bacterium]
MKNLIKSLIVIFLLSLLFVIIGCSKDDSSSSSSTSSGFFSFFKSKSSSTNSILENNPLVKKIGYDSPIFAVWDTTNKEYKDLMKKHPTAAAANNMIESMAKNDASLKRYFDILKKIYNTDKFDFESCVSKGVFFIDELSKNSFPVAMYTQLERKLNDKEVYNTIREFAKENKLTYEDVNIKGNNTVSINLADKDNVDMTVYFLVKGDGLAISNQTNLIERYLDDKYDSNYINKLLKEDATFSKSYKQSLKDGSVSFGFAALVLNSKFLPEHKIQEEIAKLPVKNLVLNQAFDSDNEMLVTRVAGYYTPQTDEQKKLANIFNSANHVDAPSTLPRDTMFSLTINMNLIKSLIKEFNLEKDFEPYMYLLNMDNINLLLQGPQASMFPSIAIIGNKVADSDKIVSDIKSTIANTKGAIPIPLNAWQKKQISSLDTEYLMTPFGVGVFLSKNGDDLIVASGESLVSDIVSKEAIKTASDVREKFSTKRNSIINIYGSSKSFARALRSINSTLSTFAKKDIPNLEETIDLLEQTPDTVIDVFSEGNTVIGETKVVLK